MSKTFAVRLHPDQFDKLARPTQPVAAIAELVWNALDADSDEVEVVLYRTDLDAVDAVTVRDHGHGMTALDVDRDFVRLGGSWKKGFTRSKSGRAMHGRRGEGRFRAFAVGAIAEWDTVAESLTGELERVVVTGSMVAGEFTVSDPEPAHGAAPGTVVRIRQPREYVNRLLGDNARTALVLHFALFLLRHPHVTIVYDGERLDPMTLVRDQHTLSLSISGDVTGYPELDLIEWNDRALKLGPTLLLCTADGGVLHELTEALPALSGFAYTAYLRWDGFADHANVLDFADTHETLAPVVEAGRNAIKQHLASLEKQRRLRIVDRWKEQRIYPFAREPTSSSEQRTQALFELVATTAAPAVSPERNQAKLTLRLLREALEDSPAALHRVLRDVLDLTPEQIEDFNVLLNQTTLSDIIRTTKLVSDRLEFLADLQTMLFDREHRKQLLERSQLHRILQTRSWVFGEQYAVVVSDKGLTKVLEAHRRLLGHESAPLTPVRSSETGGALIIDLLMSQVAETHEGRRHLVVELKRPSHTLGLSDIGQIENYAATILSEPQFQADGMQWDFWLVGDEMDDKARWKARQQDRPVGVTSQGETYRVWVKSWAELIEDNRERLHFYRDHLNQKAPEDGTLAETVDKYLHTDKAAGG